MKRFDIMYNDFAIVGPSADPTALGRTKDAVDALHKIAATKAIFASRGDNSGTRRKKIALRKAEEVDPAATSGGWYRETGSGMGATLNAAVGMDAYALTERATWL